MLQLNAEIEAIETDRRAQQPAVQALEVETKDLEHEIQALNKQHGALQSEIRALKQEGNTVVEEVSCDLLDSILRETFSVIACFYWYTSIPMFNLWGG